MERMGNTECVLQEADALISNENRANETFLLNEAAKARLIDTGFTTQQKVTHHSQVLLAKLTLVVVPGSMWFCWRIWEQ